MAIIGVCVVLLDELRGPDARRPAPDDWSGWPGWCFAVGLGGALPRHGRHRRGPHAGDTDSRRTGLDPQTMSHVHAIAVYVLVALTLGAARAAPTAAVATRCRAPPGCCWSSSWLQGLLGFVQYFLDLPEALVALHMLGAAVLSAGVTWVVLSARWRGVSPS